LDEYSEYINQLPDTDTGTITNNHNNIDRADADARRIADRVGTAVADRLGPLLGAAARGITDRLDVLNRAVARLLLQAQQPTGTAGTAGTAGAGVPPRGSTASVASGAGAASNGSNGSGTNRQNGFGRVNGTIPQYECIGGPAEAELRREISRYCAEVDRVHFGGVAGKANKAVFCAFGFKSRSQMGLEELSEVWGWIQEEWPPS
jgi:hypothetical protein